MPSHTESPTLTLRIDNPLLVVLTPYSPKNAWWINRKGILSLLADGVIAYHCDRFDSIGETVNVSHQYFKQAMRDGWSVYMAYCSKPTVWFEYEPVAWGYESDGVIIPVEPSNFVLT